MLTVSFVFKAKRKEKHPCKVAQFWDHESRPARDLPGEGCNEMQKRVSYKSGIPAAGGSARIDTYLFSFFKSSKSCCFSMRDSNRTMCCRFSSRRSSNRWICRLCDSWMLAMAVRRRATSSNSADICGTRQERTDVAVISLINYR